MNLQLEKFEYSVYTHQYKDALNELLCLLQILDTNLGIYKQNLSVNILWSIQNDPELTELNILTRTVTAISALFSDPGFGISTDDFYQLRSYHRWLGSLYAVTPFRNADHIIRSYNQNAYNTIPLQLSNDNLYKFCLLYFPDSEIEIDLDGFWNANKELAANLFLLLLSPRFLSSPEANAKFNILLRWLPEHLEEIEHLELLPFNILHDVYLNCSYSNYEDKHTIKRTINKLLRRKIESLGFQDNNAPAYLPAKGKPVMLIVLEWFGTGHSVYRVLSKAIIGLRKNFYLIGMGQNTQVEHEARTIFDKFIEWECPCDVSDFLAQVYSIAQENDVQVLYMPSIGMSLHTMFLSNLRIAPIQITTLGHSASTFSPQMDYFIIDEDFVGDESCFSEKVIKLPKDAFPFTPSINALDKTPQASIRKKTRVVQVAMTASTMKLNPVLLQTCRQIVEQSLTPVHFQFFIGFALGLTGLQVQQLVKQYLGNSVTVHFQHSYSDYLTLLAKCDLYINPFPFGNMNSIVDLLSVGLVGVCKTGREPHEHIDHGLFERLGMPKWLIAKTTDEYIDAALRLINNHEERLTIRAELKESASLNRLFEGRPELFGIEVKKLLENRIKTHIE